MSANACTIYLKEKDEVIASVETAPGGDEIWIGRSHECALRCRPDDLTVSGHHARLFWDGDGLWIEDAGSRNGLLHNGVKLELAHKLLAGELIALGGCTLVRTDAVQADDGTLGFHKLEHCNGPKRGVRVNIAGTDASPFTIGSAAGCGIVLADEFISPRHCHFVTKVGGECWIYDGGGVNGTLVNDEPLKGKGRLLKDGDLVTLAQFDFRFLDRAKPHRRFTPFARASLVIAVALSIVTAYVGYVAVGDTARDLVDKALAAAASEDFAQALASIRRASGERGGDKYAEVISGTEQRIVRWQKTSEAWGEVRENLAEGDYESARKLLDPILCETSDAWAWNVEAGLGARREAELTARALRQHFDILDALGTSQDGRPEQGIERMKGVRQATETFLAEEGKGLAEIPALEGLAKDIREESGRLAAAIAGFDAVDGAIAALGGENPDPRAVEAKLMSIAESTNSHAVVRSYAEKYAKPCRGFAESFDVVLALRRAAVSLDLTNACLRAKPLPLPPIDLCARHQQFSDFRVWLVREQEDALRIDRALGPFAQGLKADRKTLETACVERNWTAALLDDVFARPVPGARRRDPIGPYDAMFGIEFVFRAVRTLPQDCDGLVLRPLGFVPTLVAARAAFTRVADFIAFVDRSPSWLKAGAVAELHAQCVAWDGKRDGIVRFLATFQGRPRLRVVSGFAAHYLARSRDAALVARVTDEMAKLRQRLAEKVETDPVRALELALPGDPAVHGIWAQKSEGK